MKIYDIINENKNINEAPRIPGLGRAGEIAGELIGKGKSWLATRDVLKRLEPFIESGSDKYAEAVIAARKSGKAADPNPYEVLRKDLDASGLTPDQMKAVLDEVTKRAKPKIKELSAGKAPSTPPSTPTTSSTPPRDAEAPKGPSELSREKIGNYRTRNMFEAVLGNTANVFKAIGIIELGYEYYLDLEYYKAQRKKGEITEEQYKVRLRSSTEGFVAKLATMGVGIKLAQWLMTNKRNPAAISRALRITGVTLTESVIGLWADELYKNESLDEIVSSFVLYAIDPVAAKVWNLTVGRVSPNALIDTLYDAMDKAGMIDNSSSNTTGGATPNTSSAPAQKAPAQSGQRSSEPSVGQGRPEDQFDAMMRDAGLLK